MIVAGGIGFATWMIGFYTNLYYNAIIMYTIYYFFASLQKVNLKIFI